MKLWGLATNNRALINLSNLQLALSKRTTYSYFWLKDDNNIMPSGIVKNKVVGIYFEQKADYVSGMTELHHNESNSMTLINIIDHILWTLLGVHSWYPTTSDDT